MPCTPKSCNASMPKPRRLRSSKFHAAARCEKRPRALFFVWRSERRSLLLREIQLPPGLIDGHGDGVGQVEAAVAFAQRRAQALRLSQGTAYLCGPATAFRAEQKGITGAVVHLVIGLRALGGEGKQAGRLGIDGRSEAQVKAVQAVLQVGVALERRVFVIVQPGAAQALVVQLIAEGFDQMQLTPAVGAQPDNVAGIGWNFRLKK